MPAGGVFTEVRRTTRSRVCAGCRGPIHRSDPCVSVRVSPWAYGPSTGEWQVIEFCEPCGSHRYGVAA